LGSLKNQRLDEDLELTVQKNKKLMVQVEELEQNIEKL
jgi:hypothetical protein